SLMTGSDGSLDDAKDAVNELTDRLGGDDAKQAFASITGWIISLTSALAELVVQLGLGLQYSDGFFDAMVKYGMADPCKSHAEHLANIRKDIEALESVTDNPLKMVLDKGDITSLSPAAVARIGSKEGRDQEIRSLRLREQYHAAMVEREQAKAD